MFEHDTAALVVRFGVFELDLRTGELRRRGMRRPLQEHPFRVLAMLVEHPGDLVTREQLRSRLWPDVVFVDFDHGLNKAVAKVRQALGDVAESPRYVETLGRRGYRFLAAVDRVASRAALAESNISSGSHRVVWGDRTIPLAPGANLIGRDPSAVACVDSPSVSRRHARILLTNAAATLEDLGSKNGTLLNDRRLQAPSSLQDGDVIRVGPAVLTFRSAPLLSPTRTLAG
jgi:DNA-binding winged helix-turn-helix (wHTH) protein